MGGGWGLRGGGRRLLANCCLDSRRWAAGRLDAAIAAPPLPGARCGISRHPSFTPRPLSLPAGRSLFGQRISRTRSRTLETQGGGRSGGGGGGILEWWFAKPAPPPVQELPVQALLPAKTEPKTYFANERTFLSWLHMAVTIGSVASALLGFTGSTRKGEEPDEGVSATLSVQAVSAESGSVLCVLCMH